MDMRQDRISPKRRISPPALLLTVILAGWVGAPNPTLHAATTSGSVLTDETWAGTLDITGNVTVNEDITLTVQAGAVIRFADNTGLTVNGRLEVLGTADQPVTFTSASATPAPGSWTGILVTRYTTTPPGPIRHAAVTYASTGLWCERRGAAIEDSSISQCIVGIRLAASASVKGCTISECHDYGIVFEEPDSFALEIVDNHIARCGTGISICGMYCYGDIAIRNNIVRESTEVGIRVTYVSKADILFNTVVNNTYGVVLHWIMEAFTVSSNVLAFNGCGVRLYDTIGPRVLCYNAFWSNHTDTVGLSAGESDVVIDPRFVGALDFHLQPDSPCIDAGDPAIRDPDSTRSDMGAYGAGGNPPSESGNAPPYPR